MRLLSLPGCGPGHWRLLLSGHRLYRRGYEMARALGHTVVSPVPSLVPLEAEEDFCGKMQGLALKNVSLRVKNQKGKVVYQEQGELLFTHFWLSGPPGAQRQRPRQLGQGYLHCRH